MKTFPLTATVALALALSGCSGGQPAPDAVASSDAGGAGGDPVAPERTAEASAVVESGSIPRVLRGRWGLVPADCTSTRGDAKGLLTVDAGSLTFYESVARLASAQAVAPDAITATFAFSGEGQSWTLDVTLSTPDGGKTLVRKDTGPEALPEPLTYTKCP